MAFDLLQYMRGDGRMYELQYNIDGRQGTQTIQTQSDPDHPDVFYHTKGQEWERIYADEDFIYREADTSEAPDRYYVQTTDGRPGALWAKRNMELGEITERNPHVVHYFKADCSERARGNHASVLQLIEVHDSFTFDSGISLNDVMVLGWLHNNTIIEKYFYAEGFGLVSWEGVGRGRSFISEIHQNRPDLVRESIQCLPVPNNLYFAPSAVKHVRVVNVGSTGLNVRTEPRISASTLICAAKTGAVFQVVKRNPVWWEVTLFNSDNYVGGRATGYIHGAFVEPHIQDATVATSLPASGSDAEFVEVAGTGGTGLNLRTQTRVNNATKIATVKEDTIFEVVQRDGDWVQVIMYNGADFVGGRILAWAHVDFVRTIASPGGAVSEGKVIDIIDQLTKHPDLSYITRDLDGIEAHVIHHTTGPRSLTPQAVANFHVNTRGWPGIAYTFYIVADGRIFQTNHLETMSYATYQQNDRYLSTVFPGEFTQGRQPTPAQIASLHWLHNVWIPSQLGRTLPIIGHKEGLSQNTSCPGDAWDWRAAVA